MVDRSRRFGERAAIRMLSGSRSMMKELRLVYVPATIAVAALRGDLAIILIRPLLF